MKPYFENDLGQIYCGNAPDILRQLPDELVQCVVTSPPYWGLRDYGLKPIIWDDHNGCEHEFSPSLNPMGNGTGMTFRRDRKAGMKRGGHQLGFCIHCNAWLGSLGLEPTIELYISHLVQIFREIRRVIKKDAVLWLNLGDSYARSPAKGIKFQSGPSTYLKNRQADEKNRGPQIPYGLKPKDLCMIPARVALALQADGWWLRSQIPWIKRNCMPESCKDRPTNAIEYIYLLSKSRKYFYDHEAVKLPASLDSHARYARGRSNYHKYADGGPGDQTIAKSFDHMIKPGVNPKARKAPAGWQSGSGSHDTIPKGRYPQPKQNPRFAHACKDIVEKRARRNSDWFFESFQGLLTDENGDPLTFIISSKGTSLPHYATFPEKLVEPCILAGSQKGDIICDPFFGSGMVGVVAAKSGRKFIGIDLKPEYCDMAIKRIKENTRQRILI